MLIKCAEFDNGKTLYFKLKRISTWMGTGHPGLSLGGYTDIKHIICDLR